MKGYCDSCDHPRQRKLYYDEDIGIWRCRECTERIERAIARDMREFCKSRMKAMNTNRVILYPDERWY